MKTLTKENVKIGVKIKSKVNPEWGNWAVGVDRNGWTVRGDSGTKMLFEGEFKFWEIVN